MCYSSIEPSWQRTVGEVDIHVHGRGVHVHGHQHCIRRLPIMQSCQ
jgi:hypothetical protein